jgi:4-hydroxy-2-oxoheptanedioate aldolase
MDSLRELWGQGKPTFGGWLGIPSSESAESAARAGFEYVCVDNQHGAVDYQVTVRMIQAITFAGSNPIVRVPWNEPGIVGKMLDAGAEGVIVPMVNSADEARAVVRYACYPPLGSRSFGPIISGLRDPKYAVNANDRVAVIPMVETVEALNHVDEIVAVPGVHAVYVGPADLSFSLGLPPQNNDGEALFEEALATIVKACRNAGVVPGIHASGALAARRLEQGFQMITVSNDLLAMRTRMQAELGEARGAQPAAGGSKNVY